jgi:hypothetical protein
MFNFLLGGFKFVPRKFVCPPREFRLLYGKEIRQTIIESFFSVRKINKK